MDNKTPLYVLNNFLKFERKIYQVFGLKLGRPLSLKLVLYFIVIAVIEATIYFTPIIGKLINWLPFSVLVMIPILLAWLLSDVGTEGRSPVFFFRSFFSYHKRNLIEKKDYLRGRKILRANDYQLDKYITFKITNDDVVAIEGMQALDLSPLTVSSEKREVLEGTSTKSESSNQESDDFIQEKIQFLNGQFFNTDNTSDLAIQNETSLEENEQETMIEHFENHLSNQVSKQERQISEQYVADKKEFKKSSSQFFRDLKGKVKGAKIVTNKDDKNSINVQMATANVDKEKDVKTKRTQRVESLEQVEIKEHEHEHGQVMRGTLDSDSNVQPQLSIPSTKENKVEQEEKIDNEKYEEAYSKKSKMPKLTVIKTEKKAPARPQPINKEKELTTWQMLKMYARSNARNKAKRKAK